MTDAFATADTRVTIRKVTEEKPRECGSYVEERCDACLKAIFKGHDIAWTEAKKHILYELDRLKGALSLSGYPMLRADADELQTSARFCQSIDDVEVAGIADGVMVILKKYNNPRYREAD